MERRVGQARLELRTNRYRAGRSSTVGRPLVIGYLSSAIGLGHGARLLLDGLNAMGLEPACRDVTALLPNLRSTLPLPECPEDDGLGPVILHVNPPELPALLDRLKLDIRSRHTVGVWAWEQPVLPRRWKRAARFVNELWGSTRFLQQMFAEQLPGTPSFLVPYPVALNGSAPSTDNRAATRPPLRFLAAFDPKSGLERKNPFGAIEAFQRAFPAATKARLTLQVSDRESMPRNAAFLDDPRIDLVDSQLSEGELDALFREHDAFVSLHRSEGFGLSITRALLNGLPAIFTDAFGARDFADAPLAFPVRHKPCTPSSGYTIYKPEYGSWADPDIAQAVEHMRSVGGMESHRLKDMRRANARWMDDRFGGARFSQCVSATGMASHLVWTSPQ